MTERMQLEQAIAHLESQRAALGDAAVEAAIAGLKLKLAGLEQPEASGERKLVTIMFADISGFTALSEKMDPETVRALMNACFEALVPIVEKFGGTVDKFIGDEIMSLFGAPAAHENDAERAARAALEMMAALPEFNAKHGTQLGIHIGINTGLVIAGGLGSVGRQHYSVMGDAVNLASRLEDASEREEILVGPDTYRLTAPLFDFERRAPLQLKGKAEAVTSYRLLRPKAKPGAVRGLAGLHSPLVGRVDEVRQIELALQGLSRGPGGALAITGEAGLGKSRLVAEMREVHGQGCTWAEGHALAYAQSLSFWIIRDLLFKLIGQSTEAAPQETAAVLQLSVQTALAEGAAEVYACLAHLTGLPLEATTAARLSQLPPPVLQERRHQAMWEYLKALSRLQPLILVCEDLHWADLASLGMLEALLPLTGEAPVLLLLVFRAEGEPMLVFHRRSGEILGERYQVMNLKPLTRDESAVLVQNLLRIENLPAETRQRILDKAEGNPFFLEEILRELIDAGLVVRQGERMVATQAIRDLRVPDTLQGVIAARIDRLLPPDKRALQTASVIGRVFQQRVLVYMAAQESAEAGLDKALAELEKREFVRRRVEYAYIFKHILTQEVTYNSLLLTQRKALHRVAGEAIEALFPDRLEELAATLAYHFERAEAYDQAAAYLQRAGERAGRLSLYEEAIAHLSRGLELLKRLPDTPERAAQELGLLLALGTPLVTFKSYGDAEVAQVFGRARALCLRLGDSPQLFQALYFLAQYYSFRGESQTEQALVQQMLGLAQRLEDPFLVEFTHYFIGLDQFVFGQFAAAHASMERMVNFYDPQQHAALSYLYGGDDLGITALAMDACCLMCLGYADQAARRSREALALAQKLADPASLAAALAFAGCWFHLIRGEAQPLRQQAEALVRLATEQGLLFWLPVGLCKGGWALAKLGQTAEAVAQICEGLAAWQQAGAKAFSSEVLAILAVAYTEAGQIESGLSALADAAALVDEINEHHWEAEIHRLTGELQLRQGQPAEAEQSFHRAIDIARRQQAKTWELRATVSLCQLWQAQGQAARAQARLAELYGWFTEGFDTPDLQAAKALLTQAASLP